MLEEFVFLVVLVVLGLGNLVCCLVSLRKTIKDRHSVLVRRKLRQQSAASDCRSDALLDKDPANAVSAAPLPKFALSKNAAGNATDPSAEKTLAAVTFACSASDGALPPKDGLRNFSYKLSMSGDYDNMYTKPHITTLIE